MSRMIKSCLAPTSIQTLWQLLERKEVGMSIWDEPWEKPEQVEPVSIEPAGYAQCCDILSKILDHQAPDNLRYCFKKKFYYDSMMQ